MKAPAHDPGGCCVRLGLNDIVGVISGSLSLLFIRKTTCPRQVSQAPLRLIYKLQTCQGNELVVNDFKDIIESGYPENASGSGGNPAENKLMAAVDRHFAQYQQLRQT